LIAEFFGAKAMRLDHHVSPPNEEFREERADSAALLKYLQGMIVKLLERDSEYPDSAPGQPYLASGIEADDLRILNCQGRPYLYPREIFTAIDAREPDDWVTELGWDSECYTCPPPLSNVRVSENYFYTKPEAVATFWRMTKRCGRKRADPENPKQGRRWPRERKQK
jgi:hypothetical protein